MPLGKSCFLSFCQMEAGTLGSSYCDWLEEGFLTYCLNLINR